MSCSNGDAGSSMTGRSRATTHALHDWWIPPLTVGVFGLFMLIAVYVWAGSALVRMLDLPGLTPLAELDWGFAFTSLALAGFFPLSAIVYELSQSAPREVELARDLRLLNCKNSDAHIQSCRRFYAQWNYALHYLLAIVLTMLGVHLLFHPPPMVVHGWVDGDTLQAMRYGFVGAYLFAILWVYRRYTTRDLQPYVYLQCTLTIIAGLGFNYVAFEAINKLHASPSPNPDIAGVGAGLVAVTAFSLGFFPSLATRWFNRLAHSALNETQHRADQFPLGLIDGISRFHESRLLDEGIDNIQNLASASIKDLLCHTRYSAQQVVEWIDQAVLYSYLEPSEIESFRRGGVRTISDFRDFWHPFYLKVERAADDTVKPPPKESANGIDTWRKTNAQQLQSTPERLDALYRTTAVGPNMAHISHYWENLEREAEDNQTQLAGQSRRHQQNGTVRILL
jgi:hypothetical protein